MYIKRIFGFLGLIALLAGCAGGPRGKWSVEQTGATTAPAAMYGTFVDASNHRMAVILPTTGDAGATGRAIRTSVEMAVLESGADNLDVSFFDSARGVSAINEALYSNPDVIIGTLFANDARALR